MAGMGTRAAGSCAGGCSEQHRAQPPLPPACASCFWLCPMASSSSHGSSAAPLPPPRLAPGGGVSLGMIAIAPALPPPSPATAHAHVREPQVLASPVASSSD